MPKLYYCHSGLVKKTNQKDLVKMVRSKLIYPKWHFGQVGHEGKKTIWGFFLPKFPVKKTMITYSERFHLRWGIPTITLHKQVANDDLNSFASHR